MHPERSFIISDENLKKIKELLLSFKKEKLAEETEDAVMQPVRVLEVFTNMLFEAL